MNTYLLLSLLSTVIHFIQHNPCSQMDIIFIQCHPFSCFIQWIYLVLRIIHRSYLVLQSTIHCASTILDDMSCLGTFTNITSQVPQLTQPRPYPASFEDCIFIQPCAPILETKIYSDNQEVWSSCSNHVIFAALSNNIWCWVLTLSPLASFSTLPPTSFLICPTVHTHLSPHIFWSSVRLLCRILSCLCTAI